MWCREFESANYPYEPELRTVTATARPRFPLTGVILDTETTGFNHRKDKIIEIGTVAFTFDELGNISPMF
ncbi:hypothetical protein CCGE531_26905 (plasmid) [Rhizobium sp. CCGE531]|nr:hypothetical protein CCGE531_26905 [Rhizobium sp. CCGE531]AYG76601.1 hypothetical protein CCGE532_26390 [Rhizobium sp. CCGE532]